jgi:hypothetical protein
MPSTSPRRNWKSTPCSGPPVRPLASRATSSVSTGGMAGYMRSRARPAMNSISRLFGDLVSHQGAGQATVAQHRRLGGGIDHLVEPVAHEQDRLTGRREPVQGAHQPHHLGPRQRGGRLVEDEHSGVLPLLVLQGPGDGHHGPLGRPQRADQGLGAHVDLEPVEQRLGLATQRPPPDRPDRALVVKPWPMTMFSATDRGGEHSPGSGARSAVRAPWPWPDVVWSAATVVSPTVIVPAGITVVHAGQDLDEGRLPRPVAPDEGVDLAGLDHRRTRR